MSAGQARVFVAPLRNLPTRASEWIAITPDIGGAPAWSPDGSVLYFRSKRDGFHYIWAQRLTAGKTPAGDPVPIQHFHSAAFGLQLLKASEFSLTVGKDRLVWNAAKVNGTLWSTQIERE